MHFLKKKEAFGEAAIERRCVCVTVRYEDGKLLLHEGISITRPDALFVTLPDRIPVLDGEGKRVKATGKFLVSTETFNPFHLVVDMF